MRSVEFYLGGKLCRGDLTTENHRTFNVMYNGETIKRNKEKHLALGEKIKGTWRDGCFWLDIQGNGGVKR